MYRTHHSTKLLLLLIKIIKIGIYIYLARYGTGKYNDISIPYTKSI